MPSHFFLNSKHAHPKNVNVMPSSSYLSLLLSPYYCVTLTYFEFIFFLRAVHWIGLRGREGSTYGNDSNELGWTVNETRSKGRGDDYSREDTTRCDTQFSIKIKIIRTLSSQQGLHSFFHKKTMAFSMSHTTTTVFLIVHININRNESMKLN